MPRDLLTQIAWNKKCLLIFDTPEHVDSENMKLNIGYGSFQTNLSSLTRLPYTAALHGYLTRQPCPAALPGSLARQHCPAALKKSYKLNNRRVRKPAELQYAILV
jgi:hypothetical protein